MFLFMMTRNLADVVKLIDSGEADEIEQDHANNERKKAAKSSSVPLKYLKHHSKSKKKDKDKDKDKKKKLKKKHTKEERAEKFMRKTKRIQKQARKADIEKIIL